ncbi:MAG TPA: cytochrome c oxidase assembly protein [Propionibacteriaceae bacterium]|nr:cytochrome c oxidase assembly protein [Propionibacteriaceae bacterium]
MFGRLAVVLVPLHATPDDQPPPLTALRLLTEWSSDWWVLLGIAVPAVLYVAGLLTLRRRGDRWPVGRSIAFLGGGLGSALLATMTGIGAYDTVLFSVHVVQHLILTMVTPLFLAQGAPVTLALRTLPPAPRRALLALLHTRLARVLTFAPLTLALFVLTPFVLYYSPLYEITLRSAFWHAVLHLHFAITGSLLMWPLVGVDPVPGRIGFPFRLLVTFLMLPFHAFLGISLMTAERLVAEDWYLAFERSWPPSPMDDQYLAGAIMWGSGDVTAVLMLVALFVQWFRQSQREARREDRRLDLAERRRAREERTAPLGPPERSAEGYAQARTSRTQELNP